MKKIDVILLFFLCFITSNVLEAQNFKYNSNKNCGTYGVKILVNDIPQQNNDEVTINLDDYSSTINLTIEIQNVLFGLDKKCSKKKKRDHIDGFFIEMSKSNVTEMHPNGFKKLDVGIVKIGEATNKLGLKDSGRITYQVDKDKIKSSIKEKILLGFNVVNNVGLNGTFEVLVSYEIEYNNKNVEENLKGVNVEASPIEILNPIPIDTNKKEKEDVAKIEETILVKKSSPTIPDPIIINPSKENNKIEEKELWLRIESAVANQNWRKLNNYCWKYRSTFKNGPKYENAWYYSIVHAEKKEEKSVLCDKYLIEFSTGKFYNLIKKEQSALKKKSNKSNEKIESGDVTYWGRVLKENSRLSYVRYLKKYGKEDAIYSNIASSKIENFELSEQNRYDTDTSIVVNLSFVGNEGKVPTIIVLEGKENLLDSITTTSSFGQLNLNYNKQIILGFSIEGSPWKKDTIKIDSEKLPFYAKWDIDIISKHAMLETVQNGTGPFELELINIDVDEIVSRYSYPKIENTFKIVFDSLNYLNAGNYKFRIRDNSRVNSFISQSFYLEKLNKAQWQKYLIAFSIFSIFGGLLIFRAKSNKRDEPYKKEEILTTPKSNSSSNISEPKKENNPTNKIAAADNSKIRTRIKVHGIRAKYNEVRAMSKKKFNKRTTDYLPLKTSELWRDTTISKVFMSNECIDDIDTFVFKKMHEHRLPNGEVPEVGGFLLGNYTEVDGKYLVSLQKFIDIESEQSGVYQISFGAKAWSKLEEEMEDFESSTYGLMGWFHTHPGHGLFLSSPDLNIHKNFFKKPFQLAMEIDSVFRKKNPNYDVAFFTQKMDGEMNNIKDLENNWFQWDEIKEVKV